MVFPLLVLGAPIAQAQLRGDVSIGASISLGGEPIGSVDVFYDQLSAYGVWVDEPRMGLVFIPDQDGYVPYTVGHWQYTDVGFVWISNDPFGWATSHYGRWAFSPVYGRWVWLPDTEWGPAWVEWRESGDDFGWAPLAPTFVIELGYAPPLEAWHYCNAAHIFDVNIVRYYEPRDRVVVVHRAARPVEERRTIGQTRIVVGPVERLRAHRVAVRPTQVEPRAVGRLPANEARAAVVRAQQRRAQVEAENQRRIEAKPKVREVEKTVVKEKPKAQPQPQRREQPERREQAKPEPPRAQPERREQAKPEPRREQAKPEPPRAEHEQTRREQPPPRAPQEEEHQEQPKQAQRDEQKAKGKDKDKRPHSEQR